jgi:hypothetical protein
MVLTPYGRETLLPLLEALNCRRTCLRRDECGDWAIRGLKGHLYAAPEGFQMFVLGCGSARAWTAAKKALAFATVTQDGDEEGGMIFSSLPTPEQAASIRRYCAIPKRRELSDAERGRLKAMGAAHRFERA